MSLLARTDPDPLLAPPRRLTAVGVAVTTAAVAAAGGLALGVDALGQPLPAANSYADLYYPLFFAPFGVVMAVIGAVVAARRPDSRWGTAAAVLGAAWSVNALLVAGRGLAATAAGSALPQRAIAWTEDWLYLINDFGTFLALLLLFPSGRPRGRWRLVTRGLAAVVGLMMVTAMVADGPLDNTAGVRNPLGIPGTHALYHLIGDVGYPVVLLGGAVAVLVRIGAAVRGGSADGRRVGGYLGGMVACLAAGVAWMATHTAHGAAVSVGWAGMVAGLLGMVTVGAAGVLRTRV